MMERNTNVDGLPEHEAPKALTEDLRAFYGAKPSVPREVDEIVLLAARERFAVRRGRRILRWIIPPAAAAAILLGVWMAAPQFSRRPEPLAFVREDFDRNGTVDILDAFAMARQIESAGLSDRHAGLDGRRWDLTGDGSVDRKDLDVIAYEAVRIRKEWQ